MFQSLLELDYVFNVIRVDWKLIVYGLPYQNLIHSNILRTVLYLTKFRQSFTYVFRQSENIL